MDKKVDLESAILKRNRKWSFIHFKLFWFRQLNEDINFTEALNPVTKTRCGSRMFCKRNVSLLDETCVSEVTMLVWVIKYNDVAVALRNESLSPKIEGFLGKLIINLELIGV